MCEVEVKWSRELIVGLIDLYKTQPVLWQITHGDYKNRSKRYVGWCNIANALGIQRAAVEKKIRNLRCQFRNERKKLEESGDIYRTKWEYFEPLNFLIPMIHIDDKKRNHQARTKPQNFDIDTIEIDDDICLINYSESSRETLEFIDEVPFQEQPVQVQPDSIKPIEVKSDHSQTPPQPNHTQHQLNNSQQQLNNTQQQLNNTQQQLINTPQHNQHVQNQIQLNDSQQFYAQSAHNQSIVQNPAAKKRRTTDTENDAKDTSFPNQYTDMNNIKRPDDAQIFGDFVAMELRGIHHEGLQRKLKLLIQKSIICISEEYGNFMFELHNRT